MCSTRQFAKRSIEKELLSLSNRLLNLFRGSFAEFLEDSQLLRSLRASEKFKQVPLKDPTKALGHH